MTNKRLLSITIRVSKVAILPVVLALVAMYIYGKITQNRDFFVFFAVSCAAFFVLQFLILLLVEKIRAAAFRTTYATSVVVFNRTMDSVLLNLRSKNKRHYAGKYGLPGGRIAHNENTIDAARRELEEETDLRLENLHYIDSYHDPEERVSMFVYSVRVDESKEHHRDFRWVGLGDIDHIGKKLAPNTKPAILRSRRTLETCGMIYKIDKTLEHSAANVLKSVQHIDGKHGWDHYLFVHRIGIIGTSIGILIIAGNAASYKSGVVSAAGKTLMNEVSDDGGWGMRSIQLACQREGRNNISIAESTSFALLALLKSGLNRGNERIKNAVKWLKENTSDSGSLGVNSFSRSRRVFSTCMGLLALHEYDSSDTYVDGGVDWLISTQLENGAWPIGDIRIGTKNRSVPNVAATSLVMYTLFSTDKAHGNAKAVQKAASYIHDFLDKNQHIADYSEVDFVSCEDLGEPFRLEVKYDTKALLLLALSKSQEHYSHHEHRLLKSIVSKLEPSKGWSHSLTPEKHPIWTTYWNNLALHEVRKRLSQETVSAFPT